MSHNVDPLTLNFYIVKLGFTGVYINFFLRMWVLVRTASLNNGQGLLLINVLFLASSNGISQIFHISFNCK